MKECIPNKFTLLFLGVCLLVQLFPGRLWAGSALLKSIDIKDDVKQIRLSVTRKVPRKVIRVDAKEVLIALKSIELSRGAASVKRSNDWLESIHVEKLPGDVLALVATGRDPFGPVTASWDKSGRHLTVNLGAEVKHLGQKSEALDQKTGSGGAEAVKQTSGEGAVKKNKDVGTAMDRGNAPPVKAAKGAAAAKKQTGYTPPVRPSSSFAGDISDLLSTVDIEKCRSRELKTAMGHLRSRGWDSALTILTAYLDTPSNECLGQVRYLRAFAAFKAADQDDERLFAVSCFKNALVSQPLSDLVPFAYCGLGLLHLALNNSAVAEGYFNLIRQGYQDYPGLPQVLYHLGVIFDTRGFPDQALELFRRVFERMPENSHTVDAGLGMGKVLYDKKHYLDSLNIYKYLLGANPEKMYDSPGLLLSMGNAYLQLGKSREAREHLIRVFNLFPDMDGGDMIMTHIGDTYAMEEKFDRAMAVYRLVMTDFPDSEGYLASSMGLARYLEDRQEREDIYNKIKADFPDHRFASISMMRLAEIYEKAGEYSRAIEEIENLLATHPRGLRYEAVKLMQRAYESLFEKQRQSSQYTEVLKRYEAENVLLDRLESKKIFYLVGLSYLDGELYEPAFNQLLKSYKQYKRSERPPELLLGLGIAMDESGRDKDALKIFQGFVKRFPKHVKRAHACFRMGNIFLQEGAFKRAELKFEEAYRSSRDHLQKGEILEAHARVFSEQNMWKKVSPLLKKAAEEYISAPGNPFDRITSTYRKLGESYLNQGMYVKAADAFTLAMTFTGDDLPRADLRFMVGDAYQKGNVPAKAREAFEKVVATDDSIWARMAKERLDTLDLADRVKKS